MRIATAKDAIMLPEEAAGINCQLVHGDREGIGRHIGHWAVMLPHTAAIMSPDRYRDLSS